MTAAPGTPAPWYVSMASRASQRGDGRGATGVAGRAWTPRESWYHLRPLVPAATIVRRLWRCADDGRPRHSGAQVGVDVVEGVLGPRADLRVTTLAVQGSPDGLGVELAVDAGEVPTAGRSQRAPRTVR